MEVNDEIKQDDSKSSNGESSLPKNAKSKEKRQRRILPFPTISFEEALLIANGIWDIGAGEKVRRLTLFDSLNRSPDGSLSRELITGSSKYKITTGSYQAEFIELTPLGKQATNPDETLLRRLDAQFQLAITGIDVFNKIYEKYKDNKVPSNTVIADFLLDSGFSEREVDQYVELFIVNCKFIGIISVQSGVERILSIDALKDKLVLQEKKETSNTKITNVVNREKSVSDQSDDSDLEKTCFFIAPIGEEGSEQRMHSDLFLEQIVKPVLSEFDIEVIRADNINSAGIINAQIIEHLMRSKIVVADLSFHNPNVFYELAIRHACIKPTIHIIRKSDKIPFDINSFRTIVIDDSSIYTLIPQLETYKTQLSHQIRKLLDSPNEIENPISAYWKIDNKLY